MPIAPIYSEIARHVNKSLGPGKFWNHKNIFLQGRKAIELSIPSEI